MNIILSPEHEIMSDEDRALYYQMRQILDTCFLNSIKIHLDKEDHLYSKCFGTAVLLTQKEVKDLLDNRAEVQNPSELLKEMVSNCADEFTSHLRNLLAMQAEAERRGIKI